MNRVVCGASLRRDDSTRGELGGKTASRAGGALDFEASLVPREGVLDDRQPQAGASSFSRAAAIHAVEALGEARDVLGVDADPGVLDREFRAVLRTPPDEAHLAPRGGIANGVAGKVAEGAGDLGFRSHEIESRVGVKRDSLAARRERDSLALDARQQQRHVDALVAGRLW